MSSNDRVELIHAVGKAVQAFQDATDAFDEAACVKLGINRTDLRCLAVIVERGPVAVGEIGRLVGLTRGAATTALDRVERAGYVRRIRSPNDRRGVLLEITLQGLEAAGAIWGPMAAAGEQLLAGYSTDHLNAVLRFLTEARQLQLDQLGG